MLPFSYGLVCSNRVWYRSSSVQGVKTYSVPLHKWIPKGFIQRFEKGCCFVWKCGHWWWWRHRSFRLARRATVWRKPGIRICITYHYWMPISFYLWQKYPFSLDANISITLGSRGGVFDLSEVVQFLRAEKFSDIVAIRVPEAACYGDFMVIATAKSSNHVSQASRILHELVRRCLFGILCKHFSVMYFKLCQLIFLV